MKISKILKNILILPLIMGLGNNSISKHCTGAVYIDNDVEEIVDIKIGRRNKEIVIYKKPRQLPKAIEEFTKYELNLCQVQKIESDKTSLKIEGEEFINIFVTSKKNQKRMNCLISKRGAITGKSKETGWDVFYSFDKIDKLVIHKCCPKDNEENSTDDE